MWVFFGATSACGRQGSWGMTHFFLFRFRWCQLAVMEVGHLRRVLLSFFSCVLWSGSALNRNGALNRQHMASLISLFIFLFLNPYRPQFHWHFEYIMFAHFTFFQPIFTILFSTKSNVICMLEWKPKPMRRFGYSNYSIWSINNCLDSDLTWFTLPQQENASGTSSLLREPTVRRPLRSHSRQQSVPRRYCWCLMPNTPEYDDTVPLS